MASQKNGTLYIGVTTDLVKRVSEHKLNKYDNSFSKKYKTHILVYHETHESLESAITREKNMKKWNRVWKIRLIEKRNPEWVDLFPELFT